MRIASRNGNAKARIIFSIVVLHRIRVEVVADVIDDIKNIPVGEHKVTNEAPAVRQP